MAAASTTCDDELKLYSRAPSTCCVQERDEPMPPPPPRARRKAAPLAPKPAKRFKQFRRPAAPVPQAPVQAEAEDDEPSDEKKPFAFLAGRNYGVRPRGAPPPPRPGGWAAAPPDAPVRTSRVVERCDGGFDDSWLGSRRLDDEAPPYDDRAAPPAAPTLRGGARAVLARGRLGRARRAAAGRGARRDDAEQAALIDAMLDGAADQPPAPRNAPRPARGAARAAARRRRRRRPRRHLRRRRRRHRRDESRCRPCRRAPVPKPPAPPRRAPRPPTDDDDDASGRPRPTRRRGPRPPRALPRLSPSRTRA